MSLNPNDEEIILATLRTYPEFMKCRLFNLALFKKTKQKVRSRRFKQIKRKANNRLPFKITILL
jgi:hypothetical protein